MSRKSANGATRGDDAAFDLALGGGESLAQFGEAVAADQRRQQQAVGLERAADLDQRARQIIHKLQRQRRHHQIERAIGERQGLFVGGDAGKGVIEKVRGRLGRNDHADLAAGGERAPHRIGGRAEIDGAVELPQHRSQPLGHIGGDPVEQEGFRAKRPRAGPARAQEVAVEDGRVCCHLLVFKHERAGRRKPTASARRRAFAPRLARHAAAGARSRFAAALPVLPRAAWRRRRAVRRPAGRSSRSSSRLTARGSAFPSSTIPVRACCRWRPSPIRRPMIAPAPRCATTTSPAHWSSPTNTATAWIWRR